MTPSTRKKLLIGGGGVIGLLVVLLVAAPILVDANSFKPRIIAEVRRMTGRDLVLDGPIGLSLLPVPTVSAADVKFLNIPGSNNPSMVEVKSIAAQLSLPALLTGRLDVREVTLVEPRIVLEIDAEGKPNWELTPSVAEAGPAASRPVPSRPLSLGRLAIDNGTLIFSDPRTGLSIVAEKASFSASIASLDGPYALAGGATVNGAPLTIDLSIGAKAASGHDTRVALEAGEGRLSFKGSLSELGPSARLSGQASVSADNLIAFAGTLLEIAGQREPALPPLLAGKFTFDGAVELSQTSLLAKDLKLALGQDSGSGSLALTLKPALSVEGKLTVPRLDLDRWLAALARPASSQPPQTPPAAGSSAAPAPPAGPSLLANVTAKLTLDVGEVIYDNQPIRDLAVELEARGGTVAVPKLSAILPGDMVLQARSTLTGDPARPSVSGDFSLVGPKLRETLAWLDIDVSSVPPAKLARLSLKGRMASSGGNVQVNDAVFELDDLKGTGGIAVTFGAPLSVVTELELDTLDLDAFLTPSAPKTASTAAPTAPAAPTVAGPSVGLKAKVRKLIFRKQTIGGVEIDIALRGDTLRLSDIKVSNLAGARLAVRGSVANVSSAKPRPDIAFNFEAPDIDRVLLLAGATTPSGLGPVTASGGVAGSLDELSLRELAVAAAGQRLQATGTLVLPGAAGGAPKSAAFKGSLVLNGQAIEGSVDAALGGRPKVTADLKASVLDLDKLGGVSAPSRVSGRRQPAAAAKRIDTGPLRSIDGNLKLVAGTLIAPPLRIGNADIAASLKNGVLTLAHFKGALHGGSLALSGVVDATRPALSYDVRGDAKGLYLGEMLRGTSGTNQFGGRVKVTIDGRLNAGNLVLRGAGATASQLKGSLSGGADISGHVFAGTDRALQVLGTAASGVVGGVIDSTLSNVLGIVGRGNGVGVGNTLNAVALVLNRFVNRDNPIAGRIDIAKGTLTDKSLVVQGNRATAHIATRTDLVGATTDTTVNFVISEDASAPYLTVTARGPLSSPSMNVTRGTAKDPPGMASTLPGVGTLLPGGVRSPIPNVPLPIPNLPGLFGR